MAMHGWLLSGVTIAVASALGLGLGAYVTSPQSAPQRDDAAAPYSAPIGSAGADSVIQTAVEPAPRIIRCRGCGPTLAERQMAADMAGLDADGMIAGTQDPVVRDYLAAGDIPPMAPTVLPQPEGSAPPVVATPRIAPLP